MPTCPICGTEIKEGDGFCSKCWQRLVAGQASEEKGPTTGESRGGRNKKKLAAIIVPCVIAIGLVIAAATHLLPLPSGHVAEIEYVGVSAYNLSEQLFAPGLTDLQRGDLWNGYQGKRIQWTSELEYVSTQQGGLTAYFLNPLDWERTEVVGVFDENQELSLSQLSEGDLVTYTGVLATFGQNEIRLTDCSIVSRALVPLWRNDSIDTLDKRILIGDDVLCLGPSTYDDAVGGTNHVLPRIMELNRETGALVWQDEETEYILVGIDSRYVYAWRPAKIVPMSDPDYYWYWYASNLTALDGVTGQIVWDSYLSGDTHCQSQIGCLPDGWTLSDYVGCCILQGSVKEKIADEGGSGLAFLVDKPPLSELTYEYRGGIYRSACAFYGGVGKECGALQAINEKTGDVIWTMTFGERGMIDFSIVDGILYVSTDEGVGAFSL